MIKEKNNNKNKSIICFVLLIILILVLFIVKYGIGVIHKVEIKMDQSEIYSEKEIKRAMNAVKIDFMFFHGGYILTDLWYEESFSYPILEERKEAGDIENIEDSIILLSDFSKKHVESDQDWEKSYQWTVVRGKSGIWRVDHSKSGVP